jgi:hypothetical protein
MVEYCLWFSRLFFMLVRSKQGWAPEYVLNLSASQRGLVDVLFDVLNIDQGEDQNKGKAVEEKEPRAKKPEMANQAEFNRVFHKLAFSILATPTTAETLKDSYQFVLMQFLCLVHWKSDGNWCRPKDITKSLAKAQWCFRGVVWHEICQGIEGGVFEGGETGVKQ